jgi:hypothetical protein
MSQKSKKELLLRVKHQYVRTSCKATKGQLLDILCRGAGWDRKYAIKKLRSKPATPRPKIRHGGPRPTYDAAVVAALKQLWLASDQLCGRRLVPVLTHWITAWEKRHGAFDPLVKGKLLTISPAQADRLLRPFKSKAKRLPRAASEVLRQIPLRTGPWAEDQPGWIEADTLAHCGPSLTGAHAWSLTMTDIATGWTEARLCWTRREQAVAQRIAEIQSGLPFKIIGFDSDNGGEFINDYLLRYWRQHDYPIAVTRSRPWRKNDNAHVEQKNRVLIRENLGYERIDAPQSVEAFNRALKLLSLRANLYQASMKLLRRQQDPQGKKKAKKVYEKCARTPAQRLLGYAGTSPEQRAHIEQLLASHDPLELNEQIETALREGWREAAEAELASA